MALNWKTLQQKYKDWKWPTREQWAQFPKVLNKKEKVLFLIFLALFLSSGIFLTGNFYLKNTEIKPAPGGNYTEGLVGQPRFINPVYSAANDVDRDLTELIYSGLFTYNSKGEIIPQLAKNYEIKDQARVYEVFLKENVFWQDGEKLTADDIIFTIKTIQDPDYKSPLRAKWLGVKIEKISDLGIRFKLKESYSAFLENLTVKILPKHIWKDIPAENFLLTIYNLQPIGSGPYLLKEINQNKLGYIDSLVLSYNPTYFGKKPFIREVTFKFFENEDELLKAAKKGEIKGFSLSSPKNLSKCNPELKPYFLSLPRYFAVFFNPEKQKILKDKNVRLALNYGINKYEILEEILGKGEIVNSPILPKIFGFEEPEKIYQYEPEKAEEFLEKAGFKKGENGTRIKIVKKQNSISFKKELRLGSRGKEVEELQKCLVKDPKIYPEAKITGYFGSQTKRAVIKFQEKYRKEILEPWGFKKGTGIVGKTTRKKLNEVCGKTKKEILPLKLSLITVDDPKLKHIANLLKKQWENLGIEIEVAAYPISDLEKDFIKPRNYEMLLFGEVLGIIPDPFPFWHSSQKKDPGLNLANYENKKADKLLEEARTCLDAKIRSKKLSLFQDILITDAPCLFLYNPDYIYLVSKEIKGVKSCLIADPSKRLSGIENWYIKTKRKWR